MPFTLNYVIDDFSIFQNNYDCRYNKLDNLYYEMDVDKLNYDILYEETLLYTSSDIVLIREGIFTYIIVSCDDDTPELYFCRCRDINEVGTKHSHIIHRLKYYLCKTVIVVHFAGEMMVTKDTKYMFNFASGSYMRSVFENSSRRDNYVNEMMTYLNGLKTQLKYEFSENDTETFITIVNTPLSIENMNLYSICGANIRVLKSLDDCKEFLLNKREWKRYLYQLKYFEMNKKRNLLYNVKPPSKPPLIPHQLAVKYVQS